MRSANVVGLTYVFEFPSTAGQVTFAGRIDGISAAADTEAQPIFAGMWSAHVLAGSEITVTSERGPQFIATVRPTVVLAGRVVPTAELIGRVR